MPGSVITLAEIAAQLDVVVACSRCPRCGLLRVEQLMAEHGTGYWLPDRPAIIGLSAEPTIFHSVVTLHLWRAHRGTAREPSRLAAQGRHLGRPFPCTP
jgi:hypothetical protein